MSSSVIWHDTECGAYAADLGTWERLASRAGGPILELGCGTGRVTLHLARCGHEVWGIDVDPDFVNAAHERCRGLDVHTERADVRDFHLGRQFPLAIAPMQFIQMIGDEVDRTGALRRVADHLQPGGSVAAAILDGMPEDLTGAPAPLPDIREVDGRVYSSLPADVIDDGPRLELHRVRQEVSVDGTVAESEHAETLWLLDPDRLENEAKQAGLEPRERIPVPAVNGYIGSVIVVLGRP
jgi:SAM-dependent methyltransferase